MRALPAVVVAAAVVAGAVTFAATRDGGDALPGDRGRARAEAEMRPVLDALTAEVRAGLGPVALRAQVDPLVGGECQEDQIMLAVNPPETCDVLGHAVVVARIDATFRARMLALDERLRAAGWRTAETEPAEEEGFRGLVTHYWDRRGKMTDWSQRDPGDAGYSIGDLPGVWYSRDGYELWATPLDVEEQPRLVRGTRAPIPGLVAGTYAITLRLRRVYYEER